MNASKNPEISAMGGGMGRLFGSPITTINSENARAPSACIISPTVIRGLLPDPAIPSSTCDMRGVFELIVPKSSCFSALANSLAPFKSPSFSFP